MDILAYIIFRLVIYRNYFLSVQLFFPAPAPPPHLRDPCGWHQPRILNDSTGSILSPNFPSNYVDNHDCTWLVQADETHAIQITIESFITQME